MNGVRVPSVLIQRNGLLGNLKSIWTPNARVLIICSDPSNYEKNDRVCSNIRESFAMSGLSISHLELCDNRNVSAAENIENTDVLILAGGHVPTQNRFLKQLQLADRLPDYDGIIVAWSAGSMNCAGTVYAAPELEGEAIDPRYERWMMGLGITDVNIFPHYQSHRDEYLDGLRLIEDVIFTDSIGHEIIALNDGSYLMIHGEDVTVYGEAYLIKDGLEQQICADGEYLLIR